MSQIKQWADAHEPQAVGRILKRLERYSGNSTDPATTAAAEALVNLIRANWKEKTSEDTTPSTPTE